MNTHPGLETAGTYLHVQMGHTGSPWAGNKSEGPFVTISRESGAGGSSLARAIALRLNACTGLSEWTVFTGNLIEEMLQANHLSPRLARFLPEDRVSEIAATVGELVGLHPSLWELVQRTNELMRRLARSGCAILVGRGANFVTATVSRGVHVRLVAPPHHRAVHMAHLRQISEADAFAFNTQRDHARERYVRTHFNASITDPTAYDLVIDTSRVRLSEAADLVTSIVQTRMPVLTTPR